MHSTTHFWGWEVPLDIFLGGIAAGIMIISATAVRPAEARSRAVRLLPFMAPLAISAAMLALFLDLGNKLHAFRFFTAFRVTSPMSWGSWILLFVYPATILYGLKPESTFLRRANLVLGIALGTYAGVLLHSLSLARPAWSSIVIVPLFLAAAVVSGAAACKLMPIDGEEHACICKWLVAAIIAELGLLFAYLNDVRGAFAAVAPVMWSLVIVGGLAVPLLMETFELRRRVRAAPIAPALILAGGLALRFIVVFAGETP